MKDILVNFTEKPELEDTIFIEGLPGVGNVGKLAAEHLIDEIGAEKFADVYSIYFPPQVIVDEDGLTKLVKNSLYYKKGIGEDDRDLIILTGDYQGMTPQGQYKLSDELLSIAKDHDVDLVFSLGGYGQGEIIDEPKVLGAATDPEIVEKAKELDITFDEEHPSSGIVGASGLLLGLGDELYDFEGICLMGETSGYFVDPSAARVVLEALISYIGIEGIGFEALEEKAEEVESLTSKVMDMDMGSMGKEGKSEDLNYIG